MENFITNIGEKIRRIRFEIKSGVFDFYQETIDAKQLIEDIIEAFEKEVGLYHSFEDKTSAGHKLCAIRVEIIGKYIRLFHQEASYRRYYGNFHPFFDENWKENLKVHESVKSIVSRIGFDWSGRFVVEFTQDVERENCSIQVTTTQDPNYC